MNATSATVRKSAKNNGTVKILIRRGNQIAEREFPGVIVGNFGVTKNIEWVQDEKYSWIIDAVPHHKPLWSVTHIPTGMSIKTNIYVKADALELARICNEAFNDLLSDFQFEFGIDPIPAFDRKDEGIRTTIRDIVRAWDTPGKRRKEIF